MAGAAGSTATGPTDLLFFGGVAGSGTGSVSTWLVMLAVGIGRSLGGLLLLLKTVSGEFEGPGVFGDGEGRGLGGAVPDLGVGSQGDGESDAGVAGVSWKRWGQWPAAIAPDLPPRCVVTWLGHS